MTSEQPDPEGKGPPPGPPPESPSELEPPTVVVRVEMGGAARRLPRRALVAGLVAIALVVAVAAFLALRSPGGRHADGAGVLASNGSPDFHNSFGRDPKSSGPMTGAIRLCLQSGSDPAVIEAIGPDRVVGDGWRFIGASIRTISPGSDQTPIISMDGYPPRLPDVGTPAIGYSVTTGCGDPAAVPYTELMLGFDPIGTAGGGWDGIDVTYRVNGVQHVLVVRQAFVQCGSTPLPDYCG